MAAMAAVAAVAQVVTFRTTVEDSTHYYKIKGLNPTTGTGRDGVEKIAGIKPLVALIREKMFAEISWFKFLKNVFRSLKV
jgi:hypothetical protein